jgi:hypothetical protein
MNVVIPPTCFGHSLWPSSGRCVTKNKYIKMLQTFVNQCTCKILIIKIDSLSSVNNIIKISIENNKIN